MEGGVQVSEDMRMGKIANLSHVCSANAYIQLYTLDRIRSFAGYSLMTPDACVFSTSKSTLQQSVGKLRNLRILRDISV